jgi:hypothetical protein
MRELVIFIHIIHIRRELETLPTKLIARLISILKREKDMETKQGQQILT